MISRIATFVLGMTQYFDTYYREPNSSTIYYLHRTFSNKNHPRSSKLLVSLYLHGSFPDQILESQASLLHHMADEPSSNDLQGLWAGFQAKITEFMGNFGLLLLPSLLSLHTLLCIMDEKCVDQHCQHCTVGCFCDFVITIFLNRI